jgi:hypothetical protein
MGSQGGWSRDWWFYKAFDLLPQVRAGNIKAYAVLADISWAAAPDIPREYRGPRRALLHLSYSCASPFGPAILVTQDPSADMCDSESCSANVDFEPIPLVRPRNQH